ncbi:hypothetical protein ACFL96_14245 [Thermoproteota archaeon]
MKRTIFAITILMLLVLAGCGPEICLGPCEKKPIGGERDEHGCLGPAGYSWNETVGACVREWELDTESKRDAARIAAETFEDSYGLTITQITVARCPGCFIVKFSDPDYEQYDVQIANWTVVDDRSLETEMLAEKFCDDADIGAVYRCGDNTKVISKVPGAGTTYYRGDGVQIQCPVVAPDSMTEECKQIMLEDDCTALCEKS